MSDEAVLKREELQLLRQVVPWPLRITHSATLAIAQRLVAAGDAMIWTAAEPDYILEISVKGLRRLVDEGPRPHACPFCGWHLVPTPGGTSWGHPSHSRCILADFATSNTDAWNRRPGEARHG